jgi:hypothetical protein
MMTVFLLLLLMEPRRAALGCTSLMEPIGNLQSIVLKIVQKTSGQWSGDKEVAFMLLPA